MAAAAPDADRVEVGILGPLTVIVRGQPVAAGGPLQRTVLAVLAANAGHVVSADALAEAVWGEEALNRSPGTLQVYLSNLRKVLGDPATIVGRPPGYVLDPNLVAVDAAAFQADLAQAREVPGAGARAEYLQRALGRWRGAFLADLPELAGLADVSAHLADLRAAAAEDRFDAELALGRHEAMVPELEDACRRDPLRERLWGQLMLALYRSGRQADALAAYHRAGDLLADELGIDPGPALRRLQQAILEQSGSLDVADPSASSLMWFDSVGRLRRVALDEEGGLVTIGRAEGNALRLDWDEHISRRHAQIEHRGAWILSDLGSSNGTWHNSTRVRAEVALADGDRVRCGDTWLFVRLAGAPPARTPARSDRTVVRGDT